MGNYENPPYYISAYSLAVKRGFRGTLDEWLESLKGPKGEKGDAIQLRYYAQAIQYRYKDDEPWQELTDLDGYAQRAEEMTDALSDLIAQGREDIDAAVARTDDIWEAYERGEFAQRSRVLLYADQPPAGLTPIAADGVTDDTTAFQAMVDYAAENGGATIMLPPGTIRTTNKIIWKDGVSLCGAGMWMTTIKPEGTGFSAIEFDENEGEYGTGENEEDPRFKDISFEKFGIDGASTSATTDAQKVGTKGIFLVFLERVIFRDLYIRNTIGTGLGIDELRDCLIENVHLYNCGRLWSAGGLGQAGIGIGTGGMPEESFVIRDCVARGCGHYGIFIELQDFGGHHTQYKSQKAIIEGCVAEGGRSDGINCYFADDVQIIGCRSTGNARHGFSCWGDMNRVIISDSVFTANGGGGLDVASALSGQDKDTMLIRGNVIYGNTSHGINLTNDSGVVSANNITIKDNHIYGNGATGIRVGNQGTCDKLTIAENSVHDNAGQGIVLNTSGEWQAVLDNEIYGNGTLDTDGGLFIGASHTRLLVSGNRIHDNEVGLRMSSSATITNGIFRDNIIAENDTEQMSGATLVNTVMEMPVLVSTTATTISTPEKALFAGTDALHLVEPNGATTLVASTRYQKQIEHGNTMPESLAEGEYFALI